MICAVLSFLWLLAVRFNLPIVLFSSTTLVENGLKTLVAHSDGSDSYYFIKSPGVSTDKVPKYKLVVDPNGEAKIPLSDIERTTQNQIIEVTKEDPLLDYIKNFSLSKGAKTKKKKLKLVE